MDSSESLPFGELLRMFRERRNPKLSQQGLARAMSVDRQTIVAWETGKYLPKDRTRIIELAEKLHLDEPEMNQLLQAALLEPLPPWYVPYHRNLLFTGREGLLQEIHQKLLPESVVRSSQPCAVNGLGGIGKTQTALEYAYRYRHDYSAVLWLQADSHEVLISSCTQLAQEMDLPERNEADQAKVVAGFRRWLKRKTRWLLILDNVEDLCVVKEFLPPGYHGYVLLTTRASMTEPVALAYALEPMSEQEGILFLLRRAGMLSYEARLEQASPADSVHAKRLWEEVEGLPLALDQIGAYIHASRCSLAYYQNLYTDQQRRPDLLKLRGKMPPGHPESVVTTLSVAFEKIQRLDPVAVEVLQVCAFLHPKAIPVEIITRGGDALGNGLSSLMKDPLLLDQTIDLLQTYSLVRRDAQENTLSIHRLVQTVLQDSLSEQERRRWAIRTTGALNLLFPEKEYGQWNICERLVPHIVVCTQLAETWERSEKHIATLLTKMATYLRHHTAYNEVEMLYKQALRIREHIFGVNHPPAIRPLTHLRVLSIEQDQEVEEGKIFQRVLSMWEQALGADHPEVMRTLNALAILHYRKEQYNQAMLFYRQTLHMGRQILGSDHPEVTIPLDGLGRLQENYIKVESFYQRALRIWDHLLGPDHPQVAFALHHLTDLSPHPSGSSYEMRLFPQALPIRESVLGSDSPQGTGVRQGKDLLSKEG
ncbi:MAG TPA: tetratricopeptide repeat protein [Ktedonosporobacter sp.]|nr:tetratricopeptide repeat protein [Ktedonosporobacter sp.]